MTGSNDHFDLKILLYSYIAKVYIVIFVISLILLMIFVVFSFFLIAALYTCTWYVRKKVLCLTYLLESFIFMLKERNILKICRRLDKFLT